MTRVAVGGFLHETNTFAPTKATYDDFVHGGGWPSMTEGAEILKVMRKINVGLAGFVEAAEANGWELVPTIACAATPSAHVTRDAYERIVKEMIDGIAAAGSHPEIAARVEEGQQAFAAAMQDDLNTAAALGAIFELVRALNSAMDVGGVGAGDVPVIREAFDRFESAVDSSVDAGRSPSRSGTGRPRRRGSNSQTSAASEPRSSCTARVARAFAIVASILPR